MDIESQIELLQESQSLAHLGTFDWDMKSNRVTWSDELFRIYGYQPHEVEVTLEIFISHLHPDDVGPMQAAIGLSLQDGKPYRMEERIFRRDGEERILESYGRAIFDESGAPVRVIGSCLDITERRAAEMQTRQTLSRLQATLESTADGILVVDLQGRVVDLNMPFAKLWGFSRELEAGGNKNDLIAAINQRGTAGNILGCKDKVDGFADRITEIFGSPEQPSHDVLEFRDGRILECFSQPQKIEGVPVGRVWNFRDITDRRKAEAELFKTGGLLSAVAKGTTDAVFVKDLSGKYLFFNEAASGFVEKPVEEVLGKDDTYLFDPSSAQKLRENDQRVMNAGVAQTFEESLCVSGVRRTYLATKAPYRDDSGNVIGLIGISRDITQVKELEEQVRQSQKLEAIGRLAGGIAHDFNNLLTVINGYSELLLSTHGSPLETTSQFLMEIRNAGERAAALTAQLLSFSRKAIVEPKTLDLNEIVESTIQMLRRLISEDIRIVTHFAPDLPNVKLDRGQLEQVLMNLSANAQDAMPKGGILSFSTRCLTRKHLDHLGLLLGTSLGLSTNEVVELCIRDTGEGMSDEVRLRAFEPFFTTKETGQGTGLGLATVYGIVKQAGGDILLESEIGKGTTLRILLPATREPAVILHAEHLRKSPHGTETILLAEDEEGVRDITQKALELQGYSVIVADSGYAGLQLAQSHATPIHLLITDVVMPNMGGRELAQRVRLKQPNCKVLYISGYTDDEVIRNGIQVSSEAFLQKPFSLHSLAKKVRDLLDG